MTEALSVRRLFVTVCLAALLALPPATPLSAAEQLGPAPADSFSIVVIPDTQAYQGAGAKSTPASTDPVTNPIFEAHVNWIVANLDRQKIAFVSHVGDIVDINHPAQWKVARTCMDRLHGKVPYGISVGNHDMTSRGDSSLFQEYFPKSWFENFDWYGGACPSSSAGPQISGNNANSYQLFSAGGQEFVFLHLECNAPDEVLDWANAVLTKHAGRQAFITSHMGWGPLEKPKQTADFITAPKGRMRWSKIHGQRGNTPQQIWDKCYRKHPNLVAVFSGDQSRTQAMHATTPGDHGNLVHEILQDYSTGWLRLIRFLPAEQRIDVVTFDPKTEKLCVGTKRVPAVDEHQFSLKYKHATGR